MVIIASLIFLAAIAALYLGSSLTHWLTHRRDFGQGRSIGHNSVIFQATTSKFCIVVHIDPPQKLAKKSKGVWHLGGVALMSIH